MALRMGSLYDALLEANVSDDSARKAAEEVATYERDMMDIKTEMVGIRGEMATMRWMITTNLALTLAVLGRLLFIR